jgi:hypothetical protein
VKATGTLRRELVRLAEEEIVLRDPVRSIDPRQDVARACWLGEERVGHWHPLDTGFSGRRLL